jgi:hypothetical protein
LQYEKVKLTKNDLECAKKSGESEKERTVGAFNLNYLSIKYSRENVTLHHRPW